MSNNGARPKDYDTSTWLERAELHHQESRRFTALAAQARDNIATIPTTLPKGADGLTLLGGPSLEKQVAIGSAIMQHDIQRAQYNAMMAKFCLDMHIATTDPYPYGLEYQFASMENTSQPHSEVEDSSAKTVSQE